MEQAAIRFLYLKGHTPKEAFDEMKEVCGDDVPSYDVVKQWQTQLKCGHKSVETARMLGAHSLSLVMPPSSQICSVPLLLLTCISAVRSRTTTTATSPMTSQVTVPPTPNIITLPGRCFYNGQYMYKHDPGCLIPTPPTTIWTFPPPKGCYDTKGGRMYLPNTAIRTERCMITMCDWRAVIVQLPDPSCPTTPTPKPRPGCYYQGQYYDPDTVVMKGSCTIHPSAQPLESL